MAFYRKLFVSFLAVISGACSTESVAPPPPLPEPPSYLKVPHPSGDELSDIQSLFLSAMAPNEQTLEHCDSEFSELEKKVASRDELKRGMRELVANDPLRYHWCFYWELLQASNEIKSKALILDRQHVFIQKFSFLTQLARAFEEEFKDTRYLRCAVFHYSQMSDWIFFRKVEATPALTQELMLDSKSPTAIWTAPPDTPKSVLQKYGIPSEPLSLEASQVPPPPTSTNTEKTPEKALPTDRQPAESSNEPISGQP